MEKILCACGCGQNFEKYDTRGRPRKYLHGHNSYWAGKKRTQKTKDKISKSLSGKSQLGKTIKKRSRSLKRYFNNHPKAIRRGETNPNWKGGLPKCIDCGKVLSTRGVNRCRRCYWKSLIGRILSSKTKKKLSESCKKSCLRGCKHPFWRGGVTPLNKKIRKSKKYIEWRKAVFERDKYTCQECQKVGGRLHPHHIKHFALYPELRFSVDNGKTLCIFCHQELHQNE